MTSTREQMDMHREYMKRYQKQAAENVAESAQYKDYYQTLGLPRTATHAEIRAAYRALALRYHPDRNPSKEAEERWDGVPAAYAVLSNPNDRMEYDSSLETRDALVLFYSTYNPAKLDQCTIQAVIDGWHGREVELFRMLHDKYEIAPHQGTKSATEQCSLIIPEEKSAAISKDHLASAEVTPRPVSFFDTLRLMTSDLCCAAKAYYEVDSTSPGFIDMPRNTNTPGTTADPIAEAKKETNNVPEVPIVATNLTEINLEPSFAKAC
ncbi:hypothetical protein LEN26_018406 [Aphanomyces euteiches]|nr:hypothetical protein LEN26_018406 [Aphanomyces euteiches]KAH9127672.1 hypothetical protein AeMF1_002058 [Aphanomyces euteiches]KAH9189589.1 hypothetical protein AeNC1_008437 [Aphanomyces euteiches]